MNEKILLNKEQIKEKIVALSKNIYNDILKKGLDINNYIIVGIQTRGVVLAERIRNIIEEMSGEKIQNGILDITFHRDDLATRGKLPVIKETRLDFDISDKIILLVDDVLFTGRTAKAAIETVMTYGRPKAIKYIVLVDRGHRELPIQADYCGFSIETTKNETVQALLYEIDNVDDSVILIDE